MKSDIDNALETNHQRFDKFDPAANEAEEQETFPMMPINNPIAMVENVDDPEVDQNAKDDYNHARKISLNLLEQQQAMIQSMANFLNACPSVGAYDVMNRMMKTTMDMSRDLMGLTGKLREAQGIAKPGSGAPQAPQKGGDTFVFAGGPSEIMEKLKVAAEAERKILDVIPE
jgi:hypothetical protein